MGDQDPEVFSVPAWQAHDQAHPRPLQVVRPQQFTCWSKRSDNEGGEFVYGSTEGEHSGYVRRVSAWGRDSGEARREGAWGRDIGGARRVGAWGEGEQGENSLSTKSTEPEHRGWAWDVHLGLQ